MHPSLYEAKTAPCSLPWVLQYAILLCTYRVHVDA
jgi:hypothetical protein